MADSSPTPFRAPRRPRAPRVGPRAFARPRPRLLRIPVPDALVRKVRFGTDHPELVAAHFWRAVEDEMAALVEAHRPAGASRVRLHLDAHRLEVLLHYHPAPGARRSG